MSDVRLVTRLALALLLPLFAGCLYSYSKIDSSRWVPFEVELDGFTVAWSAPAGYLDGRPQTNMKGVESIRSLYYDVLSGPNIYGTWQETEVELFVARSSEDSAEKFVTTLFASYTPTEHRTFKPGWHLLVLDLPESTRMVRAYASQVAEGKYVLVRAILTGPVYEKDDLRASRTRLADDIVNTVVIR